MQPGIESPCSDENSVVTWVARKIPKTNIQRGPNLHDGSEAAELEPAAADLLLDGLVAITASVGTPVGIAHDCRTLPRNDGRTQSFLGPSDVASPELSIRRAAGIGRARHEHEVVAILRRHIVRGLQVHDGIRIAVFADRTTI